MVGLLLKFQNLSKKTIILIIILLGFALYSGSLFNNFVMDDISQVVQNPSIQKISTIPSLFSQSTSYDENNIQVGNYYKPLLMTAYALIYFFSFGAHPLGFHLAQLLLHLTNTILIYLIFSRILKKNISFIVSLLFLTHPINTEAVIYVASLQDPLFTCFGLFALHTAIKSTWKYSFILITVLMLASLLSKESGVLFLFIIPMYAYFYEKKSTFKTILQSSLALLIYFILRLGVARIYFPKYDISPIMTLNYWERMTNIPKIIIFYFKTFLYPDKLLVFQDWTIQSLTFIDFYAPLIIITLLIGLWTRYGIFLFHKNIALIRTYIFFTLWFLIGLGFHLHIIPLDQTVADRWFYFPIIGLLGMIGVIGENVDLKSQNKFSIVPILSVLIVVFFSIRVLIRIPNWKNEAVLFEHDIKYNPNSYQLNIGLGLIYGNQGNPSKAEPFFIHAASQFPSAKTYQELGIFYLTSNRPIKAVNNFEKAIVYEKNNPYHWLLLAISKQKAKDKMGALDAAKQAYILSPTKQVMTITVMIQNDQEIRIK